MGACRWSRQCGKVPLKPCKRTNPKIPRAKALEEFSRCGAALGAAPCSLDIWKTEIVLRRSKIFIATDIQIAVSSVGAAYYGQHLHTDILIGKRPNVALSALVRNVKVDRPDSSMIAAGLQADSPGRKVSVRFPTPIHSSAR